MAVAVVGVSAFAAEARANVASEAPNVSTGTAPLTYEHAKRLDTTIDTGMRDFAALGGQLKVEVGVGVTIDPVKDGGPLFSVDMSNGAIVQASWSNDRKITLKAVGGGAADGVVSVRHTLSPSVKLGLSALGANAKITYSATELLQQLQDRVGANAKFDYDSSASQAFQPWAFTPVATKLTAPNLDGSTLFTLPMTNIAILANNGFDGVFGVRAVTAPTFSYQTQSVTILGADGALSTGDDEVTVTAVDGDFMEAIVKVAGRMDVDGTMDIQPFVRVTKVPVFGNVSLEIPITATSKAYEATVPCEFSPAVARIPLPNVHAPQRGIDFGAVKVGGQGMKTVTIDNSGEMAASMTFDSSDPAFAVPGETITIAPKSTFELQIKHAPNTAGPASATITVRSNDPDSPEQTFMVGANGADIGPTDADSDEAGDDAPGVNDAEDGAGCGCKATGRTDVSSMAGYGLLGLGVMVFTRRRKAAR